MDDLISRSALLAAYDKAHKGPPGGARKLIENAPDAIVRCEYCSKGSLCTLVGMLPFIYCNGKEHELDWFCADGKRR